VADSARRELIQTAPARAAELMERDMTTGSVERRLSAVNNLNGMDGALTKPILLRALHDPNADVAEAAVLGYARTGAADAPQVLWDLMRAPGTPDDVRRRAASELHDFGGDFVSQRRDQIESFLPKDDEGSDGLAGD
jgi:hypothetical protein